FRKFFKFAIGRQLSWRANYAGQTRTKRAGISRGGSPLHGKLIFFRRATPAATRPCRKTEFANPGKHSGKLANSSVDSRQIESSGHDRGPCVLAKYFAGGLRRVFNLCRAGWLRARHPLTGRSRP